MFPRPVKLLHIAVAILVGLSLVILAHGPAVADNCDNYDQGSQAYYDCLGRSIDDLNSQLQASVNATKPLQSQVDNLSKQLESLQGQITAAEGKIRNLSDSITLREHSIANQYVILAIKVRDYYKKMQLYNPFMVFLSSGRASDVVRGLAYRAISVDDDKNLIVNITNDIIQLEADKKQVEAGKQQLAALQAKLDTQKAFFDKQIASAQSWQAQLSNQIASLSAKQQAFLAAKLAGLNIPLYALSGGGCSSDLTNGKDPGFSGGFGFFTFGVPNRVGLNQYGAWGRAKAGENDEQILHAYYNFDSISGVDTGTTIRVNNGNGINQGSVIWSGSIEDYVKRVYEVPDSWTDNGNAALKAQAIAVRSYVLAATDNGANSICANQYCQVFKTDPKGGNWDSAVSGTSGQVMLQGGKPIKAYFSSTHGGYVYATADLSGWSSTSFTKRAIDTPSGSVSSISDLRSNAYDRDSPWFYCDWGGRSQYGGTAWLKPSEMADIVNVILLAKQDSSAQSHLSQPDKPNPEGVDTWDAGTVAGKLGGSAYSTVDSVSMNFDFGSGKTTSVTVSGSGHTNTFDANTFKDYFNLRAPSNIQIVGPLYNVERR